MNMFLFVSRESDLDESWVRCGEAYSVDVDGEISTLKKL